MAAAVADPFGERRKGGDTNCGSSAPERLGLHSPVLRANSRRCNADWPKARERPLSAAPAHVANRFAVKVDTLPQIGRVDHSLSHKGPSALSSSKPNPSSPPQPLSSHPSHSHKRPPPQCPLAAGNDGPYGRRPPSPSAMRPSAPVGLLRQTPNRHLLVTSRAAPFFDWARARCASLFDEAEGPSEPILQFQLASVPAAAPLRAWGNALPRRNPECGPCQSCAARRDASTGTALCA